MSKEKSAVGALMDSMAAAVKARVAAIPPAAVGAGAPKPSPESMDAKRLGIVADVVFENQAALAEAAKADLS